VVIKGDIRIFPDQVKELLQGLAGEKFFADGILCGSWVMLVYRLQYELVYTLRTEDIDFAVETARHCAADIPDILRKLGYLPVLDADGLEKYVKGTFSIEFLVHRKGGRDAPYVAVKEMNIRAQPLPFMSMLFIDAITVDFGAFSIRIPSVEALFLHKLIIAQRRKTVSKAEKDLEQCSSLIPVVDAAKLATIADSQRFGKDTRNAISKSARQIGYPPFLK
jgi:hypothetical protein